MGQCTPAEKQEVELYALEYPEIQAELDSINEALGNYARSYEQTPPAHLKEKIAAAVKKAVTDAPKKEAKVIPLDTGTLAAAGRERIFKLLAAASIALLILSSAMNYRFYSQLNDTEGQLATLKSERDNMTAQMQEQKNSLAEVQKVMEVWSRDMQILKNPDLVPMEMKGMPIAPDAKAMAYLDNKTKDVYLEVDKLPRAPEGMQYQFWAIINGKPVSAGMIDLCEQPDTCGILKMTNMDAHAFAISLEKKGGSEQPQGNIYLAYGL
jgi:DNA-binding protein H-NS